MLHKKIVFFFLLIGAFSQSVAQEKNFIRTDLLGPFINNPFTISFERNFDSASSLVFSAEGGFYMRDKTSLFGQPYWTKQIVGYGGMLEWRYYLSYRSLMSRPVGLFTGVYARAIKMNYTQDFTTAFNNAGEIDVREETIGVGGGPVLGYKYKKPYSRWYFESLVGLGWGSLKLEQYSADDLPDQYFLWRAEICIGYSFY